MPGITRQNVGTLTPADLVVAVDLFDAKYESEGD